MSAAAQRILRRIDTIDRAPVDEADERMQPELLCTFLDVPCPCDSCPLREPCGVGLACQSFRAFVHGVSESRWRIAPRVPTRELFELVFSDGERGVGRPAKAA